MSTTQPTSKLGDADFDLSALTHHLEAEILGRETPRPLPTTSKSSLMISAAPEAIVTIGAVICVGALWLVRILPY